MSSNPEIDRMMRHLTGEACLLPRRPKTLPPTATKFMDRGQGSPPFLLTTELGARVKAKIAEGRHVEGILVAASPRGVVIRPVDGGADVVLLPSTHAFVWATT